MSKSGLLVADKDRTEKKSKMMTASAIQMSPIKIANLSPSGPLSPIHARSSIKSESRDVTREDAASKGEQSQLRARHEEGEQASNMEPSLPSLMHRSAIQESKPDKEQKTEYSEQLPEKMKIKEINEDISQSKDAALKSVAALAEEQGHLLIKPSTLRKPRRDSRLQTPSQRHQEDRSSLNLQEPTHSQRSKDPDDSLIPFSQNRRMERSQSKGTTKRTERANSSQIELVLDNPLISSTVLKEAEDEAAQKSDVDNVAGAVEMFDLVGMGAEDEDVDAVMEDVMPSKAGLPSAALLSV